MILNYFWFLKPQKKGSNKLGLNFLFLKIMSKKGLTREELLAQAKEKRKELGETKNLSKHQVIKYFVLYCFID